MVIVIVVCLTVLVGIAIVWLRFTGAGIPAGDVLDAVSLGDLFLLGGGRLTLFALIAAAAVLLTWFIDHRATELGHAVALTLLAVIGVLVAIARFDASAQARVAATVVVVAAGVLAGLIGLATTDNPVHDWLDGRRWVMPAGLAGLALACALVFWVVDERIAAVVVLVLGLVASCLFALALVRPRRRAGWLRRLLETPGVVLRAVAAPIAVLLVAGLVWLLLGNWAVPLLIALAALLVAALLAFLPRRRTFRWYAVCVFSAVLVFACTLSALNTWWEPDLRPVALLLDDGGERVGFYVADGPRAFYYGTVRRCRRDPRDLVLKPGRPLSGTGQVIRVSQADIRTKRVGSGAGLGRVFQRADGLLNELRVEDGLAPHRARAPCSEEGPIDLRVRHARPLPARRAAVLAERFRPILEFDSLEAWRPLNIDTLLSERRGGEPAHRVCDATCEPLEDPREWAGSRWHNLDLAGDDLGGSDFSGPDSCPASQPRQLHDCDRGERSAIYYRATAANDRVYVDYWWFLRYNHFQRYDAKVLCRNRAVKVIAGEICSEHEGDWEGVVAVTAAGDPERLEFVGYAEHEAVFRHPLDELDHRGERPVVYVAQGSHASYPHRCPRECPQVNRILGVHLPETNTNGEADWGRNPEAACGGPEPCLLPLPRGSWNSATGFWGSQDCRSGRRFCHLARAPRSPSAQHRYREPWCYTNPRNGHLECDPER